MGGTLWWSESGHPGSHHTSHHNHIRPDPGWSLLHWSLVTAIHHPGVTHCLVKSVSWSVIAIIASWPTSWLTYCYHPSWSSPSPWSPQSSRHQSSQLCDTPCTLPVTRLGLPYLHHPISHNNGKCVSCRAASSTCPCVFSKCCPNCIFRLQLMVSNLVTIQLPHSEFTFRFVCLGATEC